ncbi:hybrid sensor histidine kinase/response regulator [Vibrio ruber]|uniref:ATP-binding response regulator n=1 Tax=Vibrio ruber TaxID=184755 RepID=UPI00289363F4|nr:hybrid sensor histidine kinase/response regulator [Vibrio ruber]WNJ95502.1 hybrid sensor histidine kinase/response regulator [Vibrio ruber]
MASDNFIILYPKAFLLIATALISFLWLIYFLYTTAKKGWHSFRNLYYPYVIYIIFIILWIMSNAYFHTELLVINGERWAIYMAKYANIFSYMAFSSAFHFSCRLISEEKYNRIKSWQYLLLFLFTPYAIYINLFGNYTVTHVDIFSPSNFIIHFGSGTPLFFFTLILFTSLSIINLFNFRRTTNDKIRSIKSTYMSIGIIVFMISTASIHVFSTYIFHDFSLTWLPPVLSITELFLMGYAALFCRFYSWHYLSYIAITTFLSIITLLLPIVIVTSLSHINNAVFILSWCLLYGAIIHKVWEFFSQYSSLLVYKEKSIPSKKISELSSNFQSSPQQALEVLTKLLNVEKKKIKIISSVHSKKIYENYVNKYNPILIFDELAQHVKNFNDTDVNIIYEHMSKNENAVIIPLYDDHNSISQLFISPHKNDGSLYSNEEIHALQKLFKNAQIYINYQSRINQSQAMAESIAHEMRNPLDQVQLHLENLANFDSNRSLPTEIKNEIQRGIDAVQHGNQLIDIILREINQTLINYQNMATFSITKLLNLAINDFAYESEEKKARVGIKSDIDFQIHVNKTLFDFIIFNLIRNAIYYFDSSPQSKIDIELTSGLKNNQLHVTDYGPGIKPQIVHRIFDEFFTYQKKGGSGLGLSYCKRAMKLFGGDIQCHSVYGEYTRFTLSFPHVKQEEQLTQSKIDVAESPSPERLKSTHPVPASQKQKIALVTDDNSTQRALAKLYLESLQFTVYEAENGAEAVEMVRHHAIDIVFMDVQMPVMDGLKACTIIKETHPMLPVIALSGESGDDEVAQIKRIMDGWLIKPTTKQLLQQTVLKWLAVDTLQTIELIKISKPQTDTTDSLSPTHQDKESVISHKTVLSES